MCVCKGFPENPVPVEIDAEARELELFVCMWVWVGELPGPGSRTEWRTTRKWWVAVSSCQEAASSFTCVWVCGLPGPGGGLGGARHGNGGRRSVVPVGCGKRDNPLIPFLLLSSPSPSPPPLPSISTRIPTGHKHAARVPPPIPIAIPRTAQMTPHMAARMAVGGLFGAE